MSTLRINGALWLGNLAADPSPASNGMLYYNTVDAKFKFYEAGVWVEAANLAELAATTGAGLIGFDDTGLNNISGASTVQAAIADLDAAIGALDPTPTNYTPVDPAVVASHLEAIDAALATAGGDEFSDDVFRIIDDLDNTKKIAFQASAIAAATTRTISMPNADVNLADVNQSILQDGTRAMAADLSMGGNQITNLGAPSAATDAATKGYVDAVAEGLKPKAAVRVATTGPGTLATDFENGDSVDGVTLATGNRILIKDQAAPAENGIYVVQASGAPVRATDFDSLSPIDEINGAYVAVQEGTSNAGKLYVQTGVVATIGTDPINFVFFNSVSGLVGGDGITVSGSNISVDHDGEGLTFVATQLALELDGGTLSKSATGLKVADAGIDTAQLADAAVENAKLNSNLTLQGTTSRAADLAGSNMVEEQYFHSISLLANQTNTVIASFTFAHATYEGCEIVYKVKEATSNDVRIGTLRVVTNGTAIVLNDLSTETADTGISFTAAVNGANVEIRYSSGTNAATLRADRKLIRA